MQIREQSVKRPTGVTLIMVLVAIKGLVSLAMAFDLISFDLATPGRAVEPAAGVEAVIGLALLHRAYVLGKLHRSAWALTVLLTVLDAASSALELLTGTARATVWVSLALAVGVVYYLLQPGVRSLFTVRRSRT